MVATSITPQRLSARDDTGGNGKGGWGTFQIVTPVIVGGALLLVFTAYIIWKRGSGRKRSYADYRQVRPEGWVAKIPRMFVPRRRRQRVQHQSTPMTLDESMRLSGFTVDFRGTRLLRSGSSESRVPLTSTNYAFTYPPTNGSSDSPPSISKRRGFRWWWLFGSRPREVKPQEPGQRWRIDGPDGASAHGHEEHNTRYVQPVESVCEDQEDEADSVIQIGENFASVASTPMTQHFPEQAYAFRGMSPVPERSVSSTGSRTPQQATSVLPSDAGTPVLQARRDLPPSYDASHSHAPYASTESNARFARLEQHMVVPPPVRTVGYPSPHVLHGRELSSDSVLAAQAPMVATSTIY